MQICILMGQSTVQPSSVLRVTKKKPVTVSQGRKGGNNLLCRTNKIMGENIIVKLDFTLLLEFENSLFR